MIQYLPDWSITFLLHKNPPPNPFLFYNYRSPIHSTTWRSWVYQGYCLHLEQDTKLQHSYPLQFQGYCLNLYIQDTELYKSYPLPHLDIQGLLLLLGILSSSRYRILNYSSPIHSYSSDTVFTQILLLGILSFQRESMPTMKENEPRARKICQSIII